MGLLGVWVSSEVQLTVPTKIALKQTSWRWVTCRHTHCQCSGEHRGRYWPADNAFTASATAFLNHLGKNRRPLSFASAHCWMVAWMTTGAPSFLLILNCLFLTLFKWVWFWLQGVIVGPANFILARRCFLFFPLVNQSISALLSTCCVNMRGPLLWRMGKVLSSNYLFIQLE